MAENKISMTRVKVLMFIEIILIISMVIIF